MAFYSPPRFFQQTLKCRFKYLLRVVTIIMETGITYEYFLCSKTHRCYSKLLFL